MRRLYAELWRHAAGGRGTLVAALLLLVGSQVFKLAIPALSGRAINTMQAQGLAGAAGAASLLGLVFLATLASWAMHGPGRILERNVALRVRKAHSAELMGRLFAAPLAWHQRQHGAETGHRVQQSTQALHDFAQSQFIYLQSAARLVGPVVALALISAWVGLAAVVGYCVLGVIIVGFDRVMMRLAVTENAADRRYWAILSESMAAMLSILALRLRRGVERLVESRLAAVFEPVKRSIVYNEAKWGTVDILNQALWIGLVMLYVALVVAADVPATGPLAGQGLADPGKAGIPLGDLFMVYEYALQAGGVITGIAAHFQSFARQQTDFASGDPILALPAPEPGQPLPVDAAAGWRTLVFDDVHYRHPGTDTGPAIRLPRLELVRGRRYALVGPSGSGKTTLLRLLAGLYAADDGRVREQGEAAQEQAHAPAPAAARLRRLATLIPQEAQVFSGAIRENLLPALGEPPASARTHPAAGVGAGEGAGEAAEVAEAAEAAMRRALGRAQADTFVQALPGGLDGELAADGGNLSGGQRQRLALARGLLAATGSSLLLLDEPTAALDPRTERAVIEATLAAFDGAAVVASLHRLALLDRFDEVLVVVDGALVDAGPVAEVWGRQDWLRHTADGRDGGMPRRE